MTKHFTILDLASGYHQIAVKEAGYTQNRVSETERPVQISGHAIWSWRTLPATFQRMMNSLYSKRNMDTFVLVYLNEILVFSQTLEDHISIKPGSALQKMRDAKFFARLHKCSSFQEKMESTWAFMFRRYGVQPSPKKVRTVVEWPQPQSVKARSQLFGSGRILQTIYSQFQFEGQILDRSDEGWNSMAMDRNRGTSFWTAQEEFNNGINL